jgi:peptidoglycan/LPS O-acetylase OafA/YrhL
MDSVLSTRVPQLDGLRALAFFSVFLYHALNLPFGWIGVDLFFVLSGFLITTILLERRSTLRVFYLRRALRIFPPYFSTLAVILLLVPAARAEWPWHALFLTNVRHTLFEPASPMIIPLWSISIEEQFYLLWPLFVLRASPRHTLIAASCAVISAPCLRALLSLCSTTHHAVYLLPFCRWDLLGIGAALAALRLTSPDTYRRCSASAGPVLVLTTLLFVTFALTDASFTPHAHALHFNVLGYSLLVLIMASILLTALDLRSGFLHSMLTSPPLVLSGRISYSAYLIHEVLRTQLWDAGIRGWTSVIASLLSTLLCAGLMFALLEYPADLVKRRWVPYRR